MIKVMILGGYGVFGGRLSRLIADEERLTLLIAGRSLAKAEQFCRQIETLPNTRAKLQPLHFDRSANVSEQLGALNCDVIIDASGPFQAYGDDPYRVVRACLDRHIHYLDFADASGFVQGIREFDDEAKEVGVFVLSGVSSFPVLTAAVVRLLSRDLERVQSVTGGIAPSPWAGVGQNVIRAIANYAGQKVPLIRGGKQVSGYGLAESRRYTISPPGCFPLRSIRFSLVDVPDLLVIPELWPDLEDIWMGAGTVPGSLHRMLNFMAFLVKTGVLRSLSGFAGLFYRVINICKWGEHRGGMFIEVTGQDATGTSRTRSWHLLAEGDDGPFIPSMALEIIVRRIVEGQWPEPGARAAIREIELADYEVLFERRSISSGFRDMEGLPGDAPLFQKVLGEKWAELPEPLRVLHSPGSGLVARGEACVERGKGPLAHIIAGVFGFPGEGRDVPIEVTFQSAADTETWIRNFAGKTFKSTQRKGSGRFEHLLVETFGPISVGLALVLTGEEMHLVVRRSTVFGVPLPMFLTPGGSSFESVEDGRFCFNVEIALPVVGLIVRYRGWLVPYSKSNPS